MSHKSLRRFCLGSFHHLLVANIKQDSPWENPKDSVFYLERLYMIVCSDKENPTEFMSQGTASKIIHQKGPVHRENFKNILVDEKKDCVRMAEVFLGRSVDNYFSSEKYINYINYKTFAKNINDWIKQDDYLDGKLKKKLLNFYPSEDASEEVFALYIAKALFYAIKYVENNDDKIIKQQGRKQPQEFFLIIERIKDELQEKTYYEFYKRTLSITPSKELGGFTIKNEINYKVKSLRQKYGLTNGIRLTPFFMTREIAESQKFDKFIVNEVDYTSQINEIPESFSQSKGIKERGNDFKFRYARVFELDNIPIDASYTVHSQQTSFTQFPVFRYGDSFPPMKKMDFTILLAGEEKYKWQLIVQHNTPFRTKLRIEELYKNTATPDNDFINIRNDEYSPSGSGILVMVIPKEKYWSDWQK